MITRCEFNFNSRNWFSSTRARSLKKSQSFKLVTFTDFFFSYCGRSRVEIKTFFYPNFHCQYRRRETTRKHLLAIVSHLFIARSLLLFIYILERGWNSTLLSEILLVRGTWVFNNVYFTYLKSLQYRFLVWKMFKSMHW